MFQELQGEQDFELTPLVPENTDVDHSPAMTQKINLQDNSTTGIGELKSEWQTNSREKIVSGSSAGLEFSGAPAKVQQDCHITELNNYVVGSLHDQSSVGSLENFEEIKAIQVGESIESLKNHYAQDVQTSNIGRDPANVFVFGPRRTSGDASDLAQIQHSEGEPENICNSCSGMDNSNSEFEFLIKQIKYPTNYSFQLIHIKGHVPAFRCA